MKSLKKFRFIFLLSLILIALVPATQFQGPVSHSTLPAPSLQVSKPMGSGGPSAAFASAVGGVSFEQIALPANGFVVENMALEYTPTAIDGNRLQLKINGSHVNANIPDWLLIPIAKYADSEFYSCFTLFGSLNDKVKEEEILSQGGRIMNYHPSFVNTLLGLRLYFLDVLILYPHVIYLPLDDNGKTLLGTREIELDTNASRDALNRFSYFFNNLENQIGYAHRSWIITDFSQKVGFDTHNDSLKLTGAPYYYFWRFKSDRKDYNESIEESRIRSSLITEKENLIAQGELSYRQWIFTKLISSLRQYEQDYPQAFYGTIEEIVALQTDEEKIEFLDNYDHESIYENLLIPLLVYMDAQQVEHLKEYSEKVSNRPDLLRNINPMVWDAAVTTMRYAAFFRYCKLEQGKSWDKFMVQIKNVTIEPYAETPTVLFLHRR